MSEQYPISNPDMANNQGYRWLRKQVINHQRTSPPKPAHEIDVQHKRALDAYEEFMGRDFDPLFDEE